MRIPTSTFPDHLLDKAGNLKLWDKGAYGIRVPTETDR